MKVSKAIKEVRRISEELLSIEITEENLAIADAMPEDYWNQLMDDIAPRDKLAREISLLLQLEKLQKAAQ